MQSRITILAVTCALSVCMSGCEKSSPPPKPSNTANVATYDPNQFDDQLATLDEEIRTSPDSVGLYIERGELSYRAADSASGLERNQLLKSAWDDFRTAHEKAGGQWTFEFTPWDQAPSEAELAELQRQFEVPVTSTSGSGIALNGAARVCLRLFQLPQAAILIKNAEALAPDDPHVRLSVAQIEGLLTGQWDHVLPKLREFVKSPEYANDPTAWFVYGYALVQANEFEEAEQAYRKALKLDPHSNAARSNLMGILAHLGRTEEADAMRRQLQIKSMTRVYADMNQGVQLMQQGKLDEALPLLESAANEAQGLPAAWMNLGTCYLHLKRYDDALDAYSNFTTLMPEVENGYCLAASVYWERNEYDKAIEVLQVAAKLPNSTYSTQLALAQSYDALGQTGPAERALDRAHEMDADAQAVLITSCDYYLGHGQNERALADATRLVKQQRAAWTYQRRAHVYTQMGEYTKALADRKRALALAPSAEAQLTCGLGTRLSGGTPEDALAYVKAAQELQPDNAYAGCWRWCLQTEAGSAQEAAHDIAQTIAAAADGNWYTDIARFLAGRIDHEELIQRATTDGDVCEARYFIGEKTLLLGDQQAALAWFEKAVDECPAAFWERMLAEQRLSAVRKEAVQPAAEKSGK